MADWPHFRFEHEDLYARSREPLTDEREYYPSNHLYGAGEILRQYADLPKEVPLPWAVQVVTDFRRDEDFQSVPDSVYPAIQKLTDGAMPVTMMFTEAYAKSLREKMEVETHAIGHTFLYARHLYELRFPDSHPPERRGTIALPDKSDLNKLLDFDRESFAARLAALPDEFQPVYVSMHWRDFERGCHEPYLKAGLKVVCSGHPNEPEFYLRQYDIFRQFKYSCSNEISTSFALSVQSGCRFFYLDGGDVTIIQPTGTYHGREPLLDRTGRRVAVDLSPFPPDESSAQAQADLAAYFCGVSSMRPPTFFREWWTFGQQVLSDSLTTETFDFSAGHKPRDLAPWLCRGIDRDGWADPLAVLEIPHRQGFAAIEITLGVQSSSTQVEKDDFKIIINAEPAQPIVWPTQSKLSQVKVPVPAEGRTHVTLLGPAAKPLGTESRKRSFRIHSISWLVDSKQAVKSETNTGSEHPSEGIGKRLAKWLRGKS